MDRISAMLGLLARKRPGVLADIGSDHALVPILAIKKGIAERAVAGDISPAALDAGRKKAAKENLLGRIEFRLGDGLDVLGTGEAHAAVIAGMGGMRILGILERGLCRLGGAAAILQPQHDAARLRRGLLGLGFRIEAEALAQEGGRFYELIVARAEKQAGAGYTEKELELGRHSCPLARSFYEARLRSVAGYARLISGGAEREAAETKLRWLDEALTPPGSRATSP